MFVDVPILTKPEIRKDIREIQRSTIEDSDSECSVKSEDIHDDRNSYPVKPRKAPRWATQGTRDAQSSGGYDNFGDDGRDVFYDVVNVESTLNYLKNIRNTKRKLWDAEEERDAIDQQRQSYQYSVISNAKRISADRKQQEGYYKVMQGAYMRALLLQSAHTKQSTMIWDVLNALRRRKSATKAIEESITKLKAQVSSSKPRGKASSKVKDVDNGNDGSTAVLCVFLKGINKEVYLYRGQWVATNMGEGCIENIYPDQEKVIIALPFGTMYSNIRRVVCWGLPGEDNSLAEGLDVASDRALCLRWKSMENILTMTGDARRGINEELLNLTELTSNAVKNSASSSSKAATSEGDIYITDNGHSVSNTTSYADLVQQDIDTMEYDPENHNRLLANLASMSGNGAEVAAAYHLPLQKDANHTRSRMKSQLTGDSLDMMKLEDPEITMCPPNVLPHFVMSKVHKEYDDVLIHPNALSGSSLAKTQHYTTGNLVWDANTLTMKNSLDEKIEKMNELEADLEECQAQVNTLRRHAVKLAKDTSTLRMSMFTRRIRHRNTLHEHGVIEGLAHHPPNGDEGSASSEALADMAGMMNDKEPSTAPGIKSMYGKKWPPQGAHKDHATIEIGGVTIGKPGGRGKPPGWGTAAGRYASGHGASAKRDAYTAALAAVNAAGGPDMVEEARLLAQEQEEEEEDEKLSPGTESDRKKRSRIVEADWLATNEVLSGTRPRT